MIEYKNEGEIPSKFGSTINISNTITMTLINVKSDNFFPTPEGLEICSLESFFDGLNNFAIRANRINRTNSNIREEDRRSE